jgi:hypothetical protein
MGMPTTVAAPRVRALRTVTTLALLLGYADLARGGVSLAPMLLVASYVVLVPLAFLLD